MPAVKTKKREKPVPRDYWGRTLVRRVVLVHKIIVMSPKEQVRTFDFEDNIEEHELWARIVDDECGFILGKGEDPDPDEVEATLHEMQRVLTHQDTAVGKVHGWQFHYSLHAKLGD